MKTQTIILFLALIIFVPAVSNAQLGNFIKNKAAKALNAASREKAKETTAPLDSAAQKAVSDGNAAAKQIEESQNKQSQHPSEQGGMDFSKFLGGKVDLKYKDDYSFSSRLYMVMETYDKKDEVMKMDLYMYFSANTPSVGMETKSLKNKEGESAPITATMVMDGENKCFIILTDLGGTKMGMISAIPDENKTQKKEDHKFKPADLKKTGNTRVIAGYKCDEYAFSDVENKTSGKLWFTKDVDIKIDKRGWSKTGMEAYYGNSEFEGGIILGSEAYDEKGKLTMKSETKEISSNFSHNIAVKGYTLRQMNFNQGK